MPHRLYVPVAERARHRCEYCLAPEVIFNLEFEVEHVVPLALGGVDELDNLALACRSCNLRKAARVQNADPQTREVVCAVPATTAGLVRTFRAGSARRAH